MFNVIFKKYLKIDLIIYLSSLCLEYGFEAAVEINLILKYINLFYNKKFYKRLFFIFIMKI